MSSGLLASSIDMGDSGAIPVPEHVLLLDFRVASRGARREVKETMRDGRSHIIAAEAADLWQHSKVCFNTALLLRLLHLSHPELSPGRRTYSSVRDEGRVARITRRAFFL